MSDQAIEGKVVSRRQATEVAPGSGRGGPRTEYVYVTDAQGNRTRQRQGGRTRVSYNPGRPGRQSVPRGVPGWLGDREVIFMTWGVSMILVSWDEWSVNDILPRPMRLWETTWVYAILAVLSIGPLTPLMNALAIGFTIVLLWQFISKTGAFAK